MHGWDAEWFEDADGHKSGMYEKNRPGWLALKARMSDPDVIAIVAYDLSRLHRRGWRIGDLLDFVDSHDIRLVLADPNKSIDFSTPQGRLMAQLAAIFDEYYAIDISMRRKANIAYKKSLNITVGLPPFGTKRNKEGYLIPSNEGSWLLPDGSWQAGIIDEEAPVEGAIFRSYYACARRVMELYISGMSLAVVCKTMRGEGWASRTRYGNPSPLETHDARRIISNWIEYGGIVVGNRAKDRPAYSMNLDEYPLDAQRAVFDVEFLKRVGQTAAERSIKQPERGRKVEVRVYPLSGLLYCAHCDKLATKHNNPELRSRLIGKNKTLERRGSYRHRAGLECGCTRKMVHSPIIEADFLRLCQLLTVDDEALIAMRNLALDFLSSEQNNELELAEKKAAAIAKCQRRLEAVRHLYEDGDIDREEYLRRKKSLERERAHWQSYSTETERLSGQLTLCVEAVTRVASLWESSGDEDKRGLAHSLFEEIVYNLEKQRIVSFKLKSWAEQFLILRGYLYQDGNPRFSYAPSRNRICAFASGGQRSIR